MVTIIYPIVFIVAGLLVHALANHATAKEGGRALLWAGAFALAFHLTTHALRLP